MDMNHTNEEWCSRMWVFSDRQQNILSKPHRIRHTRLKGFAQMGFCLKKSGKQEEAVAAFRRALQVPSTSSKEQVQILYLLGRTLESLERIPEALESYRWLRREAPQYRDVAMRIESLSMRRIHVDNRQGQGNSPWAQQALQMWQGLLRNGK